MAPPVRSGQAEVEIIRLKRDLQRAKEVIETLQKELKQSEVRLAETENDLFDCQEELRRARQDLQKTDQIAVVRIKEAVENERATMVDSIAANESLRKEVSESKFKREYFEKQLEAKEREIEMYKMDLVRLGGEVALRKTQDEVRNFKYESAQQKRSLSEYMDQCKKLEATVQDLIAENSLLRQMAGVGSNFGIKIEDIKLLEKNTVHQYKTRISHLESEIESLENERVDLKHQLRLLSVYKGEFGKRFEGLSGEQVRHLDEYALNLISGKLQVPVSEKSKELQEENLKLKERIETMEVYIAEQIDGISRKIENGGVMVDPMRRPRQKRNTMESEGSSSKTSKGTGSVTMIGQPPKGAWKNSGSISRIPSTGGNRPGTSRSGGNASLENNHGPPGHQQDPKSRSRKSRHAGEVAQARKSFREGDSAEFRRESSRTSVMEEYEKKAERKQQIFFGKPPLTSSFSDLVEVEIDERNQLNPQVPSLKTPIFKNSDQPYPDSGGQSFRNEEEEDENFSNSSLLQGEILKELSLIKGQIHKLTSGNKHSLYPCLGANQTRIDPGLMATIKEETGLTWEAGPIELQKIHKRVKELEEENGLLSRVGIQTLETLNRREEELEVLGIEVKETRNQLENAMSLQDQLCRKFVGERRKWEKEKKELESLVLEETTKAKEAEHQAGIIAKTLEDLRSSDENSLKVRLLDLSKRLSLSEGNVLKLSRKIYQANEKIKLLENAESNSDLQRAEREKFLKDRVTVMMSDREKMAKKFQVVMSWVRDSVDKGTFEAARNECKSLNEMIRNRQTREQELLSQIALLEKKNSEKDQIIERFVDLDDGSKEICEENRLLKSRLLKIDAVFHSLLPFMRTASRVSREKVVSLLKSKRHASDSNKQVTRSDFNGLFEQLEMQPGPKWFDALLVFYHEESQMGSLPLEVFCRFFPSMSRVTIRSLHEFLSVSGRSLEEIFEMVDIDQDNVINHKGLSLLSGVHSELPSLLKGLIGERETVTRKEFIELCSLRDLSRSDETLEKEKANIWKYQFMIDLEKSARESGLSLAETFKMIDSNGDGVISGLDFREMFEKMHIAARNEQIMALFQDLDQDNNGSISYTEFLVFLKKSKEMMERVRRSAVLEKLQERIPELLLPDTMPKGERELASFLGFTDERERFWRKKVETIEAQRRMAQKDAAQYSKQVSDQTEKLYRLEHSLEEANTKSREAALTRDQFEKLAHYELIKAEKNDLLEQLATKNAAIEVFRRVHLSANELLEMMRDKLTEKTDEEVKRLKDQIEKLKSSSENQKLLGLLLAQVETLKKEVKNTRRDAADAFRENAVLRSDVIELESEIRSQQEETLNEITNICETLKMTQEDLVRAEGSANLLQRAFETEEIGRRILDLVAMNDVLRKGAEELKRKNEEMKIKLDFAEIDSREKSRLYALFLRNNESELIIELSNEHQKNNQLKMAELKLQREANQMRELKEFFENSLSKEKEHSKETERQMTVLREKSIQVEASLRKRVQELGKKQPRAHSESREPLLRKDEQSRSEKLTENGLMRKDFKEKEQKNIGMLKEAQEEIKTLRMQLEHLNAKTKEQEEQLQTKIRSLEEQNTLLKNDFVVNGPDNADQKLREEARKQAEEERVRDLALASQRAQETLKSIIESKDTLLGEKEKANEELRAKMKLENQLHSSEVKRLSSEIQEAWGKYHEILRKNAELETMPNYLSVSSDLELRRISEELERKDALIRELSIDCEAKGKEIKALHDSLEETSVTISNYSNAEIQTKNIAEEARKEVEELRRQGLEREKEIEGIKKMVLDYKELVVKKQENNIERDERVLIQATSRNGMVKSENEVQMAKAAEALKTLSKQLKETREEVKNLKGEIMERNSALSRAKEELEISRKTNERLKKDAQKIEKELKKAKDELARRPANPPSEAENPNQKDLEQLRKEIGTLQQKLTAASASREEPQNAHSNFPRPNSASKMGSAKRTVALGSIPKEGELYKIDDSGYVVPKTKVTFANYEDLIGALKQVLGELFYNHYSGFQRSQPNGKATARCLHLLRGFGIKLRESDAQLLSDGLSVDKNPPEKVASAFFWKLFDSKGLNEEPITKRSSQSGRLHQIGTEKRSIEAMAAQIKEIQQERDHFKSENMKLFGEIEKIKEEAAEQKEFARISAENWKHLENFSNFSNFSELKPMNSGSIAANFHLSNNSNDNKLLMRHLHERISELEEALEKKALEVLKEKEEGACLNKKIMGLECQIREINSLKELYLGSIGQSQKEQESEIIYRLMTQLDKSRESEERLREEIGKLEKENAQLKYYTETYDQKIERLQRRIQELTAP